MRKNQTKVLRLFVSICAIGLMIASCSYDNEEDLYPIDPDNPIVCDTLDMTYTSNVKPILENYGCVGCHQTSNPSGGVVLDSYEKTKIYAENGRLYGSVNHDDGYSPMPKGGGKLSDCELKKIRNWIDDGSPE
jgi:hypothetical protein